MTEVFTNTITNAIDAIREKGLIELWVLQDKRSVVIYIRDNGVGIEAEAIDKIFTPYFSTKNRAVNFGLGLAYCKNVVEKHGGKISAESKEEEGTTVKIALPAKRVSAMKIEEGTHGGESEGSACGG